MYTFTYILHEPQLRTATLLVALTSRVNLRAVVNFNFFSCFTRCSSNCENVPNRTRSTGEEEGGGGISMSGLSGYYSSRG